MEEKDNAHDGVDQDITIPPQAIKDEIEEEKSPERPSGSTTTANDVNAGVTRMEMTGQVLENTAKHELDCQTSQINKDNGTEDYKPLSQGEVETLRELMAQYQINSDTDTLRDTFTKRWKRNSSHKRQSSSFDHAFVAPKSHRSYDSTERQANSARSSPSTTLPILPHDVFSLVAVVPSSCTTKIVVSLTQLIQFYMYALLIQDEITLELEFMPPCASPEAYTAYFVATLIALFHQHDLLMTLHLWHQGVPKHLPRYNRQRRRDDANGEDVERLNLVITQCGWWWSFGLRAFVAVYTLIITFWVIHASKSVLDLLLNLLATESVGGLDNYVLTWAEYGFLGPAIQRDAKQLVELVETMSTPPPNFNDEQNDKETPNRDAESRSCCRRFSWRFATFQLLVTMLFGTTAILMVTYAHRPCLEDSD